MSDASEISLEVIQEVSIGEMMDLLSDFGYATTALSNEEIVNLYVAILDGHNEEGREMEELDFDG